MTNKEKVEDFINTCNWNRNIGQYINIKSSDKTSFKVHYCVPFQRSLSSEFDFRNIARRFFSDVKVVELPRGLGSGSFDITFDYSTADIDAVYAYAQDMKKARQDDLDERNRRDKEIREKRELQRTQEMQPIEDKITKLRQLAKDTDDKFEYHNYMMQIYDYSEQIQKSYRRFRG